MGIPSFGAGSWIELLVSLTASVVGALYLYQVLGPTVRGWISAGSDVDRRTAALLREAAERPSHLDERDVEARLHDALHPASHPAGERAEAPPRGP